MIVLPIFQRYHQVNIFLSYFRMHLLEEHEYAATLAPRLRGCIHPILTVFGLEALMKSDAVRLSAAARGDHTSERSSAFRMMHSASLLPLLWQTTTQAAENDGTIRGFALAFFF